MTIFRNPAKPAGWHPIIRQSLAGPLVVLAILELAVIASGFTLVHAGLNCGGLGWQGGNLSLGASGCQAIFGGQYGAWVPHGGYWTNGSYNFSYSVPYVAEINSVGSLVAIANFLAPYDASVVYLNTTVGATQETDLVAYYSANVTSASGRWDVNDTWGGSGPGWTNGSAVLGVAQMTLVWHVQTDPHNAVVNGTYRLKLDISIASWAWQDPADHLGVQFGGLAPEGSQFQYNESNRTLSEYWIPATSGGGNTSSTGHSIGQWFFGLSFGSRAVVHAADGVTEDAAVEMSTILYNGGTVNRSAVVLLTFNGTAGNYSSVEYDPWLLFATGPPPQGGGPGPGAGGTAPSPPYFLGVVGVLGVGAAVAVLAVVAWKVRSRPSRNKLRDPP